MYSFLKRQPIETYALVAFPSLLLLALLASGALSAADVGDASLKTVLFYLLFGGDFLSMAFFLFYIYLYVKLSQAIARVVGALLEREALPRFALFAHLKSCAYLFLVVGVPGLVSGILTHALGNIPPERVREGSELLMRLDLRLFGTFPPFAIQPLGALPLMDWLLINSYQHLSTFLSLVFVLLLLSNTSRFRAFLLAFFIAPFLSFPAWYALPAVSPNEMYREDIFDVGAGGEVTRLIPGAFSLTGNLRDYVQEIEEFWIDPTGESFAVTTNPSMHVAWGIIIASFGTAFFPPLGFLLVPWAFLNALGALYTLQHYAVDLFFGALAAFLAIVIARALLRLEERRLRPPQGFFLIAETIQYDAARAVAALRSYFLRFTGFLRRFPWKAS